MATSSGGGAVSVPIVINIDATGADPGGLARVERQVAQLKAELPSRVIGAIRDAKRSMQL